MSSSSEHRSDSITGPLSSKQIRSQRQGKEGNLEVGEKCQRLSDTLNPETQATQLLAGLARGLSPTSPGLISLPTQLPSAALILCWGGGAVPFLRSLSGPHSPFHFLGSLAPLCRECKEVKRTSLPLTGGGKEGYAC